MSTALKATQTPGTCNEQDLVAAVRRGDERAFEELYSRYRARIASYVYGMVGDHARTEDVVQEVFISALRRLRDTERPIAFKPWIYEIAKNASIDEFRRSRRAKEVPLEGDEDSDGPVAELPSSTPVPEVAIESKQRLKDLRGAFHGLSESHHKIIVMRELEGASYAEIGARLDMSQAMVESTLFRARKRLSEEYEELASGRRCAEVQGFVDASGSRSQGRLGIRIRRQLARHLSYCEDCRRHARMAGFDDSRLKTPSVAGKLAALLPFPWLRWRRGGGQNKVLAAGSSHPATLQSLQALAGLGDPSGPFAGFGRAAAAVAALALAGIGGGIATSIATSSSHGHSPAAGRHAVATTHGSAGGTASGAGAVLARPGAGVAGLVAPSRLSITVKPSASQARGKHAGKSAGAQTLGGGSTSGGGSRGSNAGGLSLGGAGPLGGGGGSGGGLGGVTSQLPNPSLPNVGQQVGNVVKSLTGSVTGSPGSTPPGAGSETGSSDNSPGNIVNKVTSSASAALSKVVSGLP